VGAKRVRNKSRTDVMGANFTHTCKHMRTRVLYLSPSLSISLSRARARTLACKLIGAYTHTFLQTHRQTYAHTLPQPHLPPQQLQSPRAMLASAHECEQAAWPRPLQRAGRNTAAGHAGSGAWIACLRACVTVRCCSFACVCLCTYVCVVYVCVFVCMRCAAAPLPACVCLCTCVCVCVCGICMYVCMCLYACVLLLLLLLLNNPNLFICYNPH
jgi:hypothetical protein